MPGERVEPCGFVLPSGGMQDVALIIVAGIGDSRTTIVLWRIRKDSRSPRDRGEGTTKVWIGCSRRAARRPPDENVSHNPYAVNRVMTGFGEAVADQRMDDGWSVRS